MITWLMFGCWFAAAALAAAAIYPLIVERADRYAKRRAEQASEQLEEMFVDVSRRYVDSLYLLAPLALGGLAWLINGRWQVAAAAALLGLAVPNLVITQMARRRCQTFYNQLVDGLLLLSSSLKAGLSMTQAFVVVTEEMPTPISQEFGLVLKETKMGVNLEDALTHLKTRMPSDDVTLFVTAVLVARETGGDVTRVFGRLVETLRERKKIKERIKTLTFMARLQGLIMAMLPFVFGMVVYRMNAQHFDFFLADPMGRMVFAVIGMFVVISAVLFMRFARSPL